MKKQICVLAVLLVCSTAFFVSYVALRTYAGPVGAYIYSGDGDDSVALFDGEPVINMEPGDEAGSVLHILNTRDIDVEAYKLGAKLDKPDINTEVNTFLQSLIITIRPNFILSTPIFKGTLADFIKNGCAIPADMGSLSPNEEISFIYALEFNHEAGNECQGKCCEVYFSASFRANSGDDGGDGGTNDGDGEDNSDSGMDADSADNSTMADNTTQQEQTGINPSAPDSTVLSPVATLVEPVVEPAIQAVQEHLDKLPETGWAGMAGGSLAALFLAGTGLVLKQWGRRRGI